MFGILNVALAVIALLIPLQGALAQDGDEDTSPAPSGTEHSETDIQTAPNGDTYTWTTPGKDSGTTAVAPDDHIIINYANEPQPAAPNDTTLHDNRTNGSSGGGGGPGAAGGNNSGDGG